MLKAAGEEMVELVRKLAKAVFSSGMIPADWEGSFILNLYECKGKTIDCGNYCGFNFTDQVMKLLEQVLDSPIHQMVNIDEMQFASVPGRVTIESIFIVSQLQEKYIDYVPRKVQWWAMRSLGVDEWVIRVIQGIYHNAQSHVQVNGQYSEEFAMGDGMHQSSALSTLLFILVLEALPRKFLSGVPWKLL